MQRCGVDDNSFGARGRCVGARCCFIFLFLCVAAWKPRGPHAKQIRVIHKEEDREQSVQLIN